MVTLVPERAALLTKACWSEGLSAESTGCGPTGAPATRAIRTGASHVVDDQEHDLPPYAQSTSGRAVIIRLERDPDHGEVQRST